MKQVKNAQYDKLLATVTNRNSMTKLTNAQFENLLSVIANLTDDQKVLMLDQIYNEEPNIFDKLRRKQMP